MAESAEPFFHHCEALDHRGMDYCRAKPRGIVRVPGYPTGIMFVCEEHVNGWEPVPILRGQPVISLNVLMPLTVFHLPPKRRRGES